MPDARTSNPTSSDREPLILCTINPECLVIPFELSKKRIGFLAFGPHHSDSKRLPSPTDIVADVVCFAWVSAVGGADTKTRRLASALPVHNKAIPSFQAPLSDQGVGGSARTRDRRGSHANSTPALL
ncbi:hypothetical protein PoB_000533800 [Plakobranchus ocellatus]|uniref:Uncharacterized protein n=1 Tax=Plakobranchus ocellatus TaxID=259542 RepID=A0AAV3Y9L4_9GAST|nr:hypothetical protein PoB_000533800 [Plakobranchus ocellatus]